MQRHKLSNLNVKDRSAICSICGLTKIIIRSSKIGSWRCAKSNRLRKLNYISKTKQKSIEVPKGTVCMICLQEKPLCFDHCHETSHHRGWLCRECNLALGLFYDDTGNLQRAIEYLISFRERVL